MAAGDVDWTTVWIDSHRDRKFPVGVCSSKVVRTPLPPGFKRSSSSQGEISEINFLRDSALASVNSARAMHYAAKSIFVMGGGSCFSSILPALLIFASSALSSAPTSIAKPVQ